MIFLNFALFLIIYEIFYVALSIAISTHEVGAFLFPEFPEGTARQPAGVRALLHLDGSSGAGRRSAASAGDQKVSHPSLTLFPAPSSACVSIRQWNEKLL